MSAGCFGLQMIFYSSLQIWLKVWANIGVWCLLYFSRHVWGGVRHSLKNGHVPGRNSWEDEGEGKVYTHTAYAWKKEPAGVLVNG